MADRSDSFTEDELLDYVRGSASPELSERLETEMSANATLTAEVALMRGLKPALAGDDTVNPPGEFGWRKLEAEIKREQKTTSPQPANRQTLYWRAAAAVLAVAAFGQAAYIANVSRPSTEVRYGTAASPSEAFVLGVMFAVDARAADISALLKEADGRVVGGPSAMGLYRINFKTVSSMEEGRALFEASDLIGLVAEE